MLNPSLIGAAPRRLAARWGMADVYALRISSSERGGNREATVQLPGLIAMAGDALPAAAHFASAMTTQLARRAIAAATGRLAASPQHRISLHGGAGALADGSFVAMQNGSQR